MFCSENDVYSPATSEDQTDSQLSSDIKTNRVFMIVGSDYFVLFFCHIVTALKIAENPV